MQAGVSLNIGSIFFDTRFNKISKNKRSAEVVVQTFHGFNCSIVKTSARFFSYSPTSLSVRWFGLTTQISFIKFQLTIKGRASPLSAHHL